MDIDIYHLWFHSGSCATSINFKVIYLVVLLKRYGVNSSSDCAPSAAYTVIGILDLDFLELSHAEQAV